MLTVLWSGLALGLVPSTHWNRFADLHAGEWRGRWSTLRPDGTVLDEISAGQRLEVAANEDVATNTLIFVSQSVRSDCETCFDSEETKEMPAGRFSADTLPYYICGQGSAFGPRVLRSGAMSFEACVRYGDERVRLTAQFAPEYRQQQANGQGMEAAPAMAGAPKAGERGAGGEGGGTLWKIFNSDGGVSSGGIGSADSGALSQGTRNAMLTQMGGQRCVSVLHVKRGVGCVRYGVFVLSSFRVALCLKLNPKTQTQDPKPLVRQPYPQPYGNHKVEPFQFLSDTDINRQNGTYTLTAESYLNPGSSSGADTGSGLSMGTVEGGGATPAQTAMAQGAIFDPSAIAPTAK